MKFKLSICFTDPDRGIQYEGIATGTAWEGTPERGPSYSSGGEPAEPAGCEVEKIEIESAVIDGRPTAVIGNKVYYSQYAMELKPDSADECYAGWCGEILDDNSEAIERAALEAMHEEHEAAKERARESRDEMRREREAYGW